MALNATVTIQVPDLPDTRTWFENAAAWTAYWEEVEASVNLDAIDTALYVPQAVDNTLPVYNFNIDGADKDVPSKALFDSLVARIDQLDTAFQNMRTELKDGGLITNAQ